MRTSYALASDRYRRLASDLALIDPSQANADLADVRHELASLAWLKTPTHEDRDDHRSLKNLRDWWSGSALQDVWLRLHWIEEETDANLPTADEVVRRARAHTARDQAAAKQLTDALAEAGDEASRKAVAVDAVRSTHDREHQRHIDERQRNRATLAIAASLAVAAAATVLFQRCAFGDTPFLVKPVDATSVGATSLLALVLGFGALGGFISGLVSMYLTTKSVDDTMWFDPRPTLVAVKTALGAWTAVLGVLMVGTGLVVGVYTSVPSAILLAFLFGYGQQAVTGTLLDRHVGKLTETTT